MRGLHISTLKMNEKKKKRKKKKTNKLVNSGPMTLAHENFISN